MRAFILGFLVAVVVLLSGTGCQPIKPAEIVRDKMHKSFTDSITPQYVAKYVRPLSNPVAELAHKGVDIPPEMLRSNHIALVEVISKQGKRRTIFENKAIVPPSDGFITGIENVQKIGVSYPASMNQPEIQLRVNYFCDMGDFVAVHVVVPNPLLVNPR